MILRGEEHSLIGCPESKEPCLILAVTEQVSLEEKKLRLYNQVARALPNLANH
jgi:hypothetical protein